MKKHNKLTIIGLFLISVFMLSNFSAPIRFELSESSEMLNTSDDPVLFANKDYPFHLDDYYDDADPMHIYTDANFQKTYIPTMDQINETVSYVNNSESQTPSNTDVSMTKGEFDNADYMHLDDNYYSVFTADGGTTTNYYYDSPSQWGEFSFKKGSGTTAQDILSNNGVYSTLTSGSTISYGYDSPAQWTEFAFTKGSGTTAQDIISNNGVYSTLTSGYTASAGTFYHTMRPNGDYYNNGWTTAPLWSKVNEATPDSVYIRANPYGGTKQCFLNTVDPSVSGTVPSITVYVYGKVSTTTARLEAGVYVGTNYYGSADIGLTTSSSWKTYTFSNFLGSTAGLTIGLTAPSKASNMYVYVYATFMYLTESRTVYTYSFDYTMTWIFPVGTGKTLFYDYMTSVAIDCDLDIYDWVSSGWVELQSNTDTSWHTSSYDLVANPNKVSATRQVRVRFQTASSSSNFYMYIDQLTAYYQIPTTYSFNYSMTWIFPVGTAQTLFYDYMTSVAIDCDLDIYDWVSTSWVQLQSNTGTGWITNSYDLVANPNKVSGSNQVRVRFQTASSSSNFYMYIDQLTTYYKVEIPDNAELDFTIQSPSFSNYERDDLLGLKITSNHFTSLSIPTTTEIWNDYTDTWVQLWSATRTSEYQETYTITSNIGQYFDADGKVKLQYITYHATTQHTLSVDYVQFFLVDKLDLVHTTSFDLIGEWEVRWEILGSVYYTSWVSYQVIGMANFEAISESDYPTRWILQNSTITPVEDFHDDINTDYWNLVDASSIDIDYSIVAGGDSYINSNSPTTNYGTSQDIFASFIVAPIRRGLFSFVPTTAYLFENQTGSDQVALYVNGWLTAGYNYDLYTTSSFSEGTVNWDNAPAPDVLQDTITTPAGGYAFFTISNINNYYLLKAQSEIDPSHSISVYSKEVPLSTRKPKFLQNDINKNYFGSGYMYMQTDTTELISLKSQDYGSHYTLSSGDYFEVDFETNSDSQINLILLKDDVVQKTLTISQSGNTNFNRHIVQISVSEDLEFDQLKISSTFEDTDNIQIYDIKTYKYTLTGDNADFYLGSERSKEIYLTPSTTEYNLRVYELIGAGEYLRVNTNITISESSQTQYLYIPTPTQQCRLSLFSPYDIYLPLTDYHIYVNRSLNNEYNRFALLGDDFQVDMETYIYIDVYDRYNTLIDSFSRLASDYIDLELDVYRLQIKNLMEQQTTVDINGSYVYPLLSGNTIEFMLAISYYRIGYYDSDNDYHQFTIYLDSNQAYELNRSKICFLSYADQQGNHLFFDNYKTYINGTMIYENIFYEDAGDDVNITITDRYDYQVYSGIYSVNLGDNYIPITLTMYSLKVMNQQETFNHINITRDPNYYESEYYWSEWIAPNEIVEFRLFAGYYVFNLTDTENGWSSYSYTLNGDDVLLMSSDFLISNVIYNIANVNTTIGNLITNVEINITNQNSAINNSIINVNINLGNINSTLGTMLVNLDLDITNIANNISALYTFTNNSFINIDNTINTSFIYLENNIISFNQSISNLVIGVSNDIYLINGTISTMISSLENNLLLMNVSIDTALFGLDTTLNLIGSNITSNYILLNNSIYLNNLNINDSRIAIINNLALINNTISTLILDVYTAVYLINNSIYTAVVDLGTYLSLVNNTISGNLSIVLQQNDFLTEIYKMTMFSDLLNWTNVGLNTSLLTSQIDVWEFVNKYRDDAGIVFLRYNELIANLTVSAQNTLNQYLPKENVEYRVWSVKDQKYLDEWQPLPENRSVSFGFYSTEVPIVPRPLEADFYTFMAFVIIICVGGWIIVIAWSYMKSSKDEVPEDTQLRHKRKRKAYVDRKKGFYDHT